MIKILVSHKCSFYIHANNAYKFCITPCKIQNYGHHVHSPLVLSNKLYDERFITQKKHCNIANADTLGAYSECSDYRGVLIPGVV